MDVERAKAAEEEVDPRIKPISFYVFLSLLAPSALTPLFPKAASDLALGVQGVAILNAAHGTARFFSNIPAVVAADKFGRNPLLHAAPALNAIGAMATIVSVSLPSLIFTGILMGVGCGISIVVAKLNVGDVSTPTNVGKSTAPIAAMMTLSRAFGPLLAGPMSNKFGIRVTLIVQVIICIATLGYGTSTVPETLEKKRSEWPTFGQLIKEFRQAVNLDVAMMILATATYSTLFLGMMLQGIPVICSEYCPDVLEPAKLGIVFCVLVMAPAFFAVPAGKLGDKHGHPITVFLAGILCTVACFLGGAATSAGMVIGMTMVNAVGFGIVMVSSGAQLVNVAPKGTLSKGISLHTFAADIGGMLGPILVQTLSSSMGPKIAFQMLALIGIAFTATFLYLDSDKKESAKDKARIPLPAALTSKKGAVIGTLCGIYFIGIVLNSGAPKQLHDYDHGPMITGPMAEKNEDGIAPLFITDESSSTEYAKYEQIRSRCEWKKVAAEDREGKICYKKWPTKEDWKHDPAAFNFRCAPKLAEERKEFAQDISFADCEQPVDPEDEENKDVWRFQRVGPFFGTGSYDWHDVLYNNPTNLKEAMQKEQSMFITGSYIAVVDEKGVPYPYPPIHLHHIHVYENNFIPESFERHGDAGCFSDKGGTDCLLELLPEGYGFKVSKKGLEVSCNVNDVRAANSEQIEFYFEIAFRTTPKHVIPIARAGFMLPGDPYSPATTYDLTGQPSVLWSTFKNPLDQYMWFYGIHSHMSMVDELYIFTASADDVGLNKAPYVLSTEIPWEVLPLPANGTFTTETMKAQIDAGWAEYIKTVKNSPRQTNKMCKLKGARENFDLPGIGPKGYDRKPERDCLADLSGDWKAGDLITMVAFNFATPSGKPYPQHSLLRVLTHQYGLEQTPWACSAGTADKPPDCLGLITYVVKYFCKVNPDWHLADGSAKCPPAAVSYIVEKIHDYGLAPLL